MQEINTKTYLKKKKIKKREHRRNRYRNMSEEKKQRLKEYQKIITRQKSLNIIINKCNCNCNFNSYTNKIVFLIMI